MQNRIKICYILPEYKEDTSNHFYHHYELLKKLSKKLDIFLIIEKSESKAKNIKLGNKVYVQKFKFLPFRFLESFFIILRARKLGYKIFYTHYCYIGAINSAIISKIFKGTTYYWNCAMNWLFKKKGFLKTGYRLSLKLSDFLVTGSEEMKKAYAKNYNLSLNKIKIVPNWINLKRFKSHTIKKESKFPKLLIIHWLSKRKGADMIVPIASRLSKILTTKYKLLVIGNGPYKKQLEKEIKKNRLTKNIKTIGAVPNKNIVEYYNWANIFIMPSMEEGFPRVLLEAMAMGVPYIATDIGAVKELSSETAQRFLVKAGDVEKFVHKLEILLTDKVIYNEFKKQNLEKVKEYSLEKVSNKFIKLFKN
jgi:glycosyltransferase involved in cell wall biosynthesis